MNRDRFVVCIFVVASALFALAGCSSIEEDLCEAECACEGCSELQHSECLQDYDADQRAAEYRGCEGLYDDLVDCEDATGVCIAGDWKTSCKPENDRYKACVDAK
jgi:hypothetical protein